MSFPVYQTVQYKNTACKNTACYKITYYNPKPGSTCVDCMEPLSVCVGYLKADKENELQNEPQIEQEIEPENEPGPLERTGYQEMWFDEEKESTQESPQELSNSLERTVTSSCHSIDEPRIFAPRQLKRTDNNDHEHVTNKKRVVQEIMQIYGLDRKGAIEKLDQMVKSVIVEYV